MSAGDKTRIEAALAAQDAINVAVTRLRTHRVVARKLNAEAEKLNAEAERRLLAAQKARRDQWRILWVQVAILAAWGVFLWWWGW